jgi:hypothetical protein
MLQRASSGRIAVVVAIVCGSVTTLLAQTVIKPPNNRYTPEQDVEIGREGAEEIRREFPIIRDERVTRYLNTLGDRLVAQAPPELNNPVFEYSFTPVNLKEINAFALPGGPMFVHRGMFDAAASEGEVVGVMAHELSHVLLRHGTANASKAQNPWLQLGQLAGALGGAMVGGVAGSAIQQGSQVGLGTLLLRYSRDFEKQADLLGAQIMARAGYDPRELARMFETIEKESKANGGGGAPQWLSSHPNPGNRTQYITQEAAKLTIASSANDGRGFEAVRTTFASLPPAVSLEDLAKAKKSSEGGGGTSTTKTTPSVGTPGRPVPAPASEYRTLNGGNVFQTVVPVNWTSVNAQSAVRVVPQNGYGELNGETVFSHGVEFGIVKTTSRNLQAATNTWLNSVARRNPGLRLARPQESIRISGRAAIASAFVNPSPVGGQERIGAYTTFLTDGSLFYFLTVVPDRDAAAFDEAFQQIGRSLRLVDRR